MFSVSVWSAGGAVSRRPQLLFLIAVRRVIGPSGAVQVLTCPVLALITGARSVAVSPPKNDPSCTRLHDDGRLMGLGIEAGVSEPVWDAQACCSRQSG